VTIVRAECDRAVYPIAHRVAMRHTIHASVCVLVLWAASATLLAQESTSVDLQAAVDEAVLPVPAIDGLSEGSALQRRRCGRGFSRPWGFQVGVLHYGNGDFFNVGSSSTQITPAVLYEFAPTKMGAAIPNPNLAAERATTAEAGYDTPLTRFSTVSATGFYTAVTELVQPFFLKPNLFQLQNVVDVRNSGFEAEWRVRPNSIRTISATPDIPNRGGW